MSCNVNVLYSKDKCSAGYSGKRGSSEAEVKAIMAYFKRIAPVYGAIDFHSYGQDVLFPYSKLIIHYNYKVTSSLLFHMYRHLDLIMR